MRNVICLLIHLLTTIASLLRPGGSRSVIAENLQLKQQLIRVIVKSGVRRPESSGDLV
jgi:hypothetical protein